MARPVLPIRPNRTIWVSLFGLTKARRPLLDMQLWSLWQNVALTLVMN